MQSEVKSAIGLDFAGLLRTLLRSDPDIIMVGEIRDIETARWRPRRPSPGTWCSRRCTRATRPRPCTAWSRWACRRIWCPRPSPASSRSDSCAACARTVASRGPCARAPGRSSASARRPRRQMKVYEAAGCTRCFGTGYLGRVGIFEVLALDEEMADMIERGVPGARAARGRSRQRRRVRARRRRAQGPRRRDEHLRARAGGRVADAAVRGASPRAGPSLVRSRHDLERRTGP